jgi:hypothetical protein
MELIANLVRQTGIFTYVIGHKWLSLWVSAMDLGPSAVFCFHPISRKHGFPAPVLCALFCYQMSPGMNRAIGMNVSFG